MYRNRQFRFLLGVGLVIVLLAILFIVIFTRGSSAPPTHLPRPMASYSTDPTAQVAMLIDGPVNAISEHNQVQVVVTNSNTTINIFQGYNDQVIRSSVYPMDEAAFHVFLRSLESAAFNSGSNDPSLSQASGYCPTGDRYIFSFNVDGRQLERYWTTSCGGTHTYNGNLNLTVTLFEAQVPDYVNLISGINI